MSEFVGLYDVRDYVESDLPLVKASFLKGLYYGEDKDNHSRKFYSLIPKDIFMNNYGPIADALISSPNTTVKIACLKEDPNTIIAYSILSADYQTIHWVFCKRRWRGKGIGKSLIPARPTSVTHLSDLGRTLMNKFENLIFNPFQIG